MTTSSSPSSRRQHESTVNIALAELLREILQTDVEAESLHGRSRPDIIVRKPNEPVIVETEFFPAKTVEIDARSRLRMRVNGGEVRIAFAVTIPESLRNVSGAELKSRLQAANLEWYECRLDGTRSAPRKGAVEELSRSILEAKSNGEEDLESAINILEEGAKLAGSWINNSPGNSGRVAKDVFGREPSEEISNMAALIVINAMMFHDRLIEVLPELKSVALTIFPRREAFMAPHRRMANHENLVFSWDYILSVNYWPVFKLAQDIVFCFSYLTAKEVIPICATTSSRLLAHPASRRHDLAGRIFNTLVKDRKFLAAFYTSVPAATLLSGLALDPARWENVDWSDIESIKRFRVTDPACGTGTLLMSAYQEMTHNHNVAGGSGGESLHKSLIEEVICGADVVEAGIHLTACSLATMSPSVEFEHMKMYSLPLGMDPDNGPMLGSLEWLDERGVKARFTGASSYENPYRVGGKGKETVPVTDRPMSSLVIANPPFTRFGSDSGKGELNNRVFGHVPKDIESKLTSELSKRLADTPANQIAGLASAFIVLADRMLEPRGRIAFVLPATSMFGASWSGIRSMLAEKYEIEYVITSHDPERRSFSFDTNIGEILFVARQLSNGEKPSRQGVFVNLWRPPLETSDAVALSLTLRNASQSPMHSTDSPPIGGTPIFIGDEQWGEIIKGPTGDMPWSAARWKFAAVGQIGSALQQGIIYNQSGTQVLQRFPITALNELARISPHHLSVKGNQAPFNIYKGNEFTDQFPSLWHLRSNINKRLNVSVDSHLQPKPVADIERINEIWSYAGRLHIAPDVRLTSQPLSASFTSRTTLGVRSWHTLNVREEHRDKKHLQELALGLWLNTTLSVLIHTYRSNPSQLGRAMHTRSTLQDLPVLDVRQLKDWQLNAARRIWEDFTERAFKPLYMCAVDEARIELDLRFAVEVLGIADEQGADESLQRMRLLLASEPSVHGTKSPVLPRAK